MEGLKQIDDVAYVRFASVYRNFREARDFESLLDELQLGERKAEALAKLKRADRTASESEPE